jgi:hypothetical protein
MAVAVGAFQEIVVFGKPEVTWGTGLGLALIASSSVVVPVSLVAAVAEDVLKRPLTPPGKNPPEEEKEPGRECALQ